MEPLINPAWNKVKFSREDEGVQYIRWGMDTVTEYNERFNNFSIYSDLMPLKPVLNFNLKTNAKAARNIFDGKMVYMVPLFNYKNSYSRSRNFYYTYYQNLGFDICDLGLLHPKKNGYVMELGSHMGNEGGLMKSILIGKWLKGYFSETPLSHSRDGLNPFDGLFKESLKRSKYLVSSVSTGDVVYLSENMRVPVVWSYIEEQGINISISIKGLKEFYFLEEEVGALALSEYDVSFVKAMTVSEYVKSYNSSLVVLSIADEGSLNLSDETKSYLELLGVPIHNLKYRGSLAVVINNGSLISYGLSNEKAVSLQGDVLLSLGVDEVVSAGRLSGNISKIIIEGKNQSKGRRGINIVIKTDGGHIISTVSDTFLNDQVKASVVKLALKKSQ